jgi:hypothetical protein
VAGASADARERKEEPVFERLRGPVLVVAAAAAAAALVAGAAASTNQAAPHKSAYRFTTIAALGDPAPGGGQFTFDFEPSDVADNGTLPVTADVTTGGEGVFVARHGRITQLTRTGLPAPGGGTMSANGEMGRLGLSASGDVAVPFFVDGFPPPCDFPAAGVYRYSHSSQTFGAVAVPGMAAPGGGTFEGVWFNTAMNNRGDTVFSGLATGTDIDPASPPGCDGIAAALYLADKHGTLSTVVRPGDPAAGGGVFDDAVNGSINDRGDVAFGGHVQGDPCTPLGPFACAESVYLKTAGGAIRSIAHQGDPSPCGGAPYTLAFGPVLNSRGDVAFVGRLTPDRGGVFLFTKGAVVPVACPGDAMPGGGHMFSAGCCDATYGLDNRGDVGLSATLDTDVNGDGVPDTGLYVLSHGSLGLVARTGTVIPGLGTIAYLGLGPARPNPPFAAGGPISERGQLPFFATLDDGRGLFLLATP